MNKKLKFIIKFTLGILILLFLLSKTKVQEVISLLNGANYIFFILSVILYIAAQICTAKKWSIISERLYFHNSFYNYIKWYFLGLFYNTFLPTSIGGDIVKVLKIKDKKENSVLRSIFSVLSCRISGLFVLVLFLIVGIWFYHSNILANTVVISIISTFIICLMFFICIVKKVLKIPEKYSMVYDYILALCNKKTIIEIFSISIICHIISIIIQVFIAKMYNLNIPISYYLLIYPLMSLLASLPLSINGIGIKEAVYVYMLGQIHINASSAVLFIITYNMVTFFTSLLGVIPFMDPETKVSKEELKLIS